MAAPMIALGTTLSVDVVDTPTAFPLIKSITLPNIVPGQFPAQTLDQATPGIPKLNTGYTDSGTFSFTFFFDTGDPVHQEVLEHATTPTSADDDVDWLLTFTSTDTLAWKGGGAQFGGAVEMDNGVEATFTVPVNGDVTFSETV